MPTKVAVVRCDSYDYELVYKNICESVSLIGGLDIKKGEKVLIKPNILGAYTPDQAVTTHPVIVDALCRILKEKGAEILIGDSSGMGVIGGTKNALETSGIKAIAEKNNVKAVALETKPTTVRNESGVILKEIRVSQYALDVDYIISVPKLKTHGLMKYTGALKNMFGLVPGGNKPKYHSIAQSEGDFGNLLVDIYQKFAPHLSIMDAVMGIEGNGPGSAGQKKKVGLIIASRDAVALDFAASRIIGYEPMEIKTNKFAVERGLFNGKVEVVGEKNISVPFKKPVQAAAFVPKFVQKGLMKFFVLKPKVLKDACVGCRTCIVSCPAKTIHMKGGVAEIDLKKCIRCYCCHELCPHNAIELRKSAVMETITRIRKITKL